MRKILKEEINDKIYSTVFNKDLSINKQKKILYKYLNSYKGSFINSLLGNFKEISEEHIEGLIIESIRIKEFEETKAFDKIVEEISEIILRKECKILITK